MGAPLDYQRMNWISRLTDYNMCEQRESDGDG